MLKRTTIIFILTLLLIALFSVSAVQAQGGGRYVILFEGRGVPANAANIVARAGGQLVNTLPEVGIGVAVSSDANFASNIAGAAKVEAAGHAGMWALPNTQVYTEAHHGPTPVDTGYADYGWDIRRVDAPTAWMAGITGSHDTVVAVIDTGVDASHPDLRPNIVYEACMMAAGPCAPGTFTHWHGTHVAGTVAATFGNGRAVGVGPNLGLAAYQVFEAGGGGAWDDVIWWALIDAAHNGFEVANMSLGGYITMDSPDVVWWTAWNRVANYVNRAGLTVVASAGNAGVDLNGELVHLPGDVPGIINVGATGIQSLPLYPQADSYDIRAFYSNYGAPVTLSAPGGDCGEISTCSGAPPSGYPWFWYLVYSTYPGGYAWSGGTSMAGPACCWRCRVGLGSESAPQSEPGSQHFEAYRTESGRPSGLWSRYARCSRSSRGEVALTPQ